MSYNEQKLKTDQRLTPIPQYYNPNADAFEPLMGVNGASRSVICDASGNLLFTSGNPAAVSLTGSNVAEQKTQANAVSGSVTFSKPIQHLEIYNVDSTNTGVFTVNGINITVPAGKSFKASYAGTPSTIVTVTGSTSYILTRYE